jgi:hypothetical protein
MKNTRKPENPAQENKKKNPRKQNQKQKNRLYSKKKTESVNGPRPILLRSRAERTKTRPRGGAREHAAQCIAPPRSPHIVSRSNGLGPVIARS